MSAQVSTPVEPVQLLQSDPGSNTPLPPSTAAAAAAAAGAGNQHSWEPLPSPQTGSDSTALTAAAAAASGQWLASATFGHYLQQQPDSSDGHGSLPLPTAGATAAAAAHPGGAHWHVPDSPAAEQQTMQVPVFSQCAGPGLQHQYSAESGDCYTVSADSTAACHSGTSSQGLARTAAAAAAAAGPQPNHQQWHLQQPVFSPSHLQPAGSAAAAAAAAALTAPEYSSSHHHPVLQLQGFGHSRFLPPRLEVGTAAGAAVQFDSHSPGYTPGTAGSSDTAMYGLLTSRTPGAGIRRPLGSTAPGAPAVPDTGADEYTGYRLVYQLDRFTSSYRTLVVFYLAMFIACYAQVVNVFVFWGTWCSLVLMYWEPYLAPPYPWTSDYTGREECFSRVEPWGKRPRWMKPADAIERAALGQWLFAVRRGLNPKQMQAYKFLVGLIIGPCASLWTGVISHLTQDPLADPRAMFSCFILLFLVSTYTFATSASLLLHDWSVVPRLRRLDQVEIAWRTNDMLYFTCKILGEMLNVTVQTLVAGAFVSYMPIPIFWLSILITALSYTATNLLFGMNQGEGPPEVSADGTASVWGSAVGSPGPLAYPSTFGNALFNPGMALNPGASDHNNVTLAPHTNALAGSSSSSAVGVGIQAWRSGDGVAGVESGDGVSPHAAAKPQQFLMHHCPWLDLSSPGAVLPPPPAAKPCHPHPQQQQQQHSQGGWLELPTPGRLPPTPHPRKQQLAAHLVAFALPDSADGSSSSNSSSAVGDILLLPKAHPAAAAPSIPSHRLAAGAPALPLAAAAPLPTPAAPKPTPTSPAPVFLQGLATPTPASAKPRRRQLFQMHGDGLGLFRRKHKPAKPKGPPTPPFLAYTAPRGWRDWCIVGLLIVVAAPSAAILCLVSWGLHAGQPELYFDDPTASCTGPCLDRYMQVLVLMCALGLLICYYAFTVGFLQAGPVTWVYRRMSVVTHAGAERLSAVGGRIHITLAGGRGTG